MMIYILRHLQVYSSKLNSRDGNAIQSSKGEKDMQRFLIIIEKGSHNYSAFVPDLPGCVATGKTLEEVKANMRDAIRMHIEGMIEDHEPIPASETMADYMDVAIPDSAA
jgi:predicted RNase H-like HicB family nuclease